MATLLGMGSHSSSKSLSKETEAFSNAAVDFEISPVSA